MNEEQDFEFKVEMTVTFEVFRKFFISMMCRNRFTALLMKMSPYIFVTGVFFCLLDMILFKEDSIGVPLLTVVLLMGVFMLLLYYGQPRAVYNAGKKEFSLPYKYIFNENGFYVGRESFDKECFVPYSNIGIIFESDSSFYFGYSRKTFIIEKSCMDDSQVDFLSKRIQSENPKKYIKIKD